MADFGRWIILVDDIVVDLTAVDDDDVMLLCDAVNEAADGS